MGKRNPSPREKISIYIYITVWQKFGQLTEKTSMTSASVVFPEAPHDLMLASIH
jgi:hypothetical protein